MVTMANSPLPTIDGSGNWGSVEDDAAAARYVEARLSKFAAGCFFEPGYVETVRMQDNYDDSRKEPVELPARECNLLLNGSQGIAVGTTCNVPSFHRKGVRKLVMAELAGGADVKTAKKLLDFNLAWGGVRVGGDDDAFEELLKNGRASIRFGPKHVIEGKTCIITGLVANIKSGKAMTRMAADQAVDSIVNETSPENGLRYVISLRRNVPAKDAEKAFARILRPLHSTEAFRLAYLVHGEEGIEFRTGGLLSLVKEWTEGRVELERRSIRYRMSVMRKRLERLDLLQLAWENRDTLDAARDEKDPKAYVRKRLDVDDERAEAMMQLTVRQLSRLHAKDVDGERKSVRKELAERKEELRDARATLLEKMKEDA